MAPDRLSVESFKRSSTMILTYLDRLTPFHSLTPLRPFPHLHPYLDVYLDVHLNLSSSPNLKFCFFSSIAQPAIRLAEGCKVVVDKMRAARWGGYSACREWMSMRTGCSRTQADICEAWYSWRLTPFLLANPTPISTSTALLPQRPPPTSALHPGF